MMDVSAQGPLTEGVYYILLNLNAPMHGYGIIQNVERMTKGRLVLGAGTLYGALTSLVERQWIQPADSDDSSDSRRKDYLITERGKMALAREMERLEELLANGRTVVERGIL